MHHILVNLMQEAELKEFFSLGNKMNMQKGTTSGLLRNNEAVHTEYIKIKALIAFVAEAKVGVMFINCKEAVGLRVAYTYYD
eukprot:2568102-Ditylum_brightwellii.AAC.1